MYVKLLTYFTDGWHARKHFLPRQRQPILLCYAIAAPLRADPIRHGPDLVAGKGKHGMVGCKEGLKQRCGGLLITPQMK